MSRRKERIIIDTSSWSEEKHTCAKLFAVAWTVPEDKAIEFSGVSSWVLKSWEEQGLIEKVDTKGACFYIPTKYGEQHFVDSTGHRCYKSNKDSWRHNYKLLDVYINLDNEEKDSWKTEADLKREARDAGWDMESFSVTDGSYIDSETGEIMCVEIETKHYKEQHIQAKSVYVEKVGGHYESHRV